MKKHFLKIAAKVILLLVASMLYGCSSVCPEGVKFGPYAVMCAPYEMYKFGENVAQDLKPGGMLNPDGKPDGMSDAEYAVYRLNKRINQWGVAKSKECSERFTNTNENNILINEKIEFENLNADCTLICKLNKTDVDTTSFQATLIKNGEVIRSFQVPMPTREGK